MKCQILFSGKNKIFIFLKLSSKVFTHCIRLLEYNDCYVFLYQQDVIILGHAADQTEFDAPLVSQGRLCMNLVDTDRALIAREHGYQVTLCSLQPLTCTPKNNLLIGKPKS